MSRTYINDRKMFGLFIGVFSLIFLFLNSCGGHRTANVKAKVYGETFYGLNHDMHNTFHKIKEGHKKEFNLSILHDQLHLMKNILHIIKKGNEEEIHWKKLHELNHEMRDKWHKVKKGEEEKKNLNALQAQLHEMKELIHEIKGDKLSHDKSSKEH